jgi:hypothetical protein
MNQKIAVTLIGVLLALGAFSGPGLLLFANAASSPSALNNVQIFINTSTNNFTSYSLSVYNSSGYSIASSTSNYPAFGVELPSGTYLFTVTATQNNYYVYAKSTAAPVASSNTATIAPLNSAVEYGYTEQQVTGPATYNITTTSITDVQTTNLVVHTSYANGTAASGTSIQASIVGDSYYYGYNSKIVMWNTTGPDGTATLVVPNYPIQLSAWNWIQINLPKNYTTIQTTVGGELVNVTVYWSPSYVGLAATTLLMPPFSSVSLTLHQQQPRYWVMPSGVQTASGYAQPSIASGPGGVPASVYGQQQSTTVVQTGPVISPLLGAATTTQTITTTAQDSITLELLSIAVIAAVALAAVGLMFAVRRK